MIAFADEYLAPYRVKGKAKDGTEEIIPKYCPFCKGGDSKDEETFALSINKGIYVCKRGSCGQRGKFQALAESKGVATSVKSSGVMGGQKDAQYVLPTTELHEPTEAIYKYFEARKISRKTFRIYYDCG